MLFSLVFIASQSRMGNMACQSNNPLRLTAERSLKLKIKKGQPLHWLSKINNSMLSLTN